MVLVFHVSASSAPASLRQVRQEGWGIGQRGLLTDVLGYIYGAGILSYVTVSFSTIITNVVLVH